MSVKCVALLLAAAALVAGCYGHHLSKASGNALYKAGKNGSLNPVILERSKSLGKTTGRAAGNAAADNFMGEGDVSEEDSGDPRIDNRELKDRIEELKRR